MSVEWSKVTKALKGGFCEISLTGEDINGTLDKSEDSFDDRIFTLKSVNSLLICNSNLTKVSPQIGKLVKLAKVCFLNNKLSTLPSDIGLLTSLKTLDLSSNCISTLPETCFAKLSSLETLKLNSNQLTDLPDLSGMTNLHHVHLSHNNLTVLPDAICKLLKLLTITVAHNRLEYLPNQIGQLTGLRTLHIQDNQLFTIPKSFSQLKKLVELDMEENPFKSDRKLKKLSAQKPTPLSSILTFASKLPDQMAVKPKGDSIAAAAEEEPVTETAESASSEPAGAPSPQSTSGSSEFVNVNNARVSIKKALVTPEEYIIKLKNMAKIKNSKRPQVYACVVRNLSFHGKLKKFIKYQEKLHDTLGKKREEATIGTHDMTKLTLPLSYEIRPLRALKVGRH